MKKFLLTVIMCSLLIQCTSCSLSSSNNSDSGVTNNTSNRFISNANKPDNYSGDTTDKTNNSNSTINNEENLIDLQKKGLEVIEDQSFWVEFKNWGKVKFISGKFLINGTFKLRFYLIGDNGKVLYKFTDFHGNEWPMFSRIRTVSFKDVNKDGLMDIIIIAEYMTGVGEHGAIPFPVSGIYFRNDKQFVSIPELDEEINNANNNENIDMILKFIEGKDIKLNR